MVKEIKVDSILDIQLINQICVKCDFDVGVHNKDSTMVIDAKTFFGWLAFDFTQPIKLVCEDERFFRILEAKMRK